MYGAIVNTHASDRGNEPVTWNQFHTFANQMDARFIAIDAACSSENCRLGCRCHDRFSQRYLWRFSTIARSALDPKVV